MMPVKIDKSRLAISEPKRVRSKAHLRFVATMPCVVCGMRPVEVHHLKYLQPRARGLKVSDEFTVPLCSDIIVFLNRRARFRQQVGHPYRVVPH